MSALPKNLVPMPKQHQVAGIKAQTVEISPTNGSFNTVYAPHDRIIFQIPAYSNGFLDVSKSFLKFKPTLTATGSDATNRPFFADGFPIFERMIVKSGSGAVIEDIQDVDLLENILEGLMEKSDGSSRKALMGDGLAGLSKFARTNEKFVVKRLPGGLLGPEQEFYLPLHLMGGPYSLEVELVLANANRCMACVGTATAADYTISGVTLQLEVVNMPEDVCKKLDLAICSGEEISLPFSTYRSYRNTIPLGSTQTSLQIHEVSPNVESVMLAFESTVFKLATAARYELEGGSNKVDGYNIVDEYSFRYGSEYMPLQPCKDLGNGSAPALMNVLRDLKIENPKICADSEVDGSPIYFVDKFFIVQNMQTDTGLVSGLNTSAHAGPIESFIKFTAPISNALRATHFSKTSQSLSVSRNGVTSLGLIA